MNKISFEQACFTSVNVDIYDQNIFMCILHGELGVRKYLYTTIEMIAIHKDLS